MTNLLIIIFAFNMIANQNLKQFFNLDATQNIEKWRIVNDVVMGGRSNSKMALTDDGYALFSGKVSLENNGGFASVQLDTSIKLSQDARYINLRVKGDGKNYEFRIKGNIYQRESYVHQFSSSGEWENVKLELSEFYPQFRGRKLDISNFNFQQIEQISFLIANQKAEDFALQIDWIAIE